MPVLLSELINEATPPKKHIRKKENYTLLDDYLMDSNYTSFNSSGYNSDEVIGPKVKVSPNPPPNYLMTNSMSNFPPQYVKQFRDEPNRGTSFEQSVMDQQKDFKPINQINTTGQFAGSVPYMQNASKTNDRNAVMNGHSKEGFRQVYSMYQGQGCIDTLNHIAHCPMCARYFQCDTKVYNVIIFMLIILFTTIIYFLYREEKK